MRLSSPGHVDPLSRGLMPGRLPHIRPVQRPPAINMGAVAQARTRPQAPLPQPHLNLMAGMPSFLQNLPQTKLPKLSAPEHQAIQAIKNYYPKDPGLKANHLIVHPTPAMQIHLNNMVGSPQKHNYAMQALQSSKSWTDANDPNNPFGTKQLAKLNKQLARQKPPPEPQRRGFAALGPAGTNYMGLPVLGPALGYAQRLGAGVSEDVTAGGVGLMHLPGAMRRDPVGTVKAMGKETATSMYDTVRHPVRMFWDHPDQGLMNALTVASFGAGAVGRGLKAADVASSLGRGEISTGEAARALPGALIRTPRFERNLRMAGSKAPGVHFDRNGVDALGIHKDDYVVDPAHLAQGYRTRIPIYTNRAAGKAGEARIGAPGMDHAAIGEKEGQLQASAHINPDTGQVENVHFHSNTGLTPAREKALQQALIKRSNSKLLEAANRNGGAAPGISVTPPAFKSTLGGLIHTKVVDPLTEKLIEARPNGSRAMVFNGGAQAWAERHMGKLMRRDVDIRTGMERGRVEQQLLQQYKDTGKLPEGIVEPTIEDFNKLKREGLRGKLQPKTFEKYREQNIHGQIQARAYAEGAATSHANIWHSLWNGGKSARESFDKNPNAYVGIRRPPDSWSAEDIAKYSSERQIFHQWNRTVETDPEKLAADPEAYMFIPKSMWRRLRPGEASGGVGWDYASRGLRYIDAGNQAIRAGRFIHPGYAAWAVQNGVLHVSQAGMHVFRNIYQLRNQYMHMSDSLIHEMDNSVGAGHFGGGIARATAGGEESVFRGTTKRLARFWHNIDDKVPRRLSLIHELNRMGYHNAQDWENLLRTNPRKFRAIAQKAQHQAIDYAEMSPAERATMQKLFTAYGWTRGASTYTARFPLEHPVQATAMMELARQGKAQRDKFWNEQGGMVPDWLRGSMPFGKGAHPWLIGTGDINPGETLGQSLESIGLTTGPRTTPAEQLGPAAQGLYEFFSGQDRFGNPIKGGLSGALGQAASDTAKRFTPLSYFNTFTQQKKGGGTFLEGGKAGIYKWLGIPAQQLRDPKTTAALGMKDWEQALQKPDEIKFRYNWGISQLPKEIKLYEQKSGTPLDGKTISMIRGDMEAVEQRDMYQYKYASARGAHSFRSLPAVDRAKAGIEFMLQHKYLDQSDARSLRAYMSSVHSETDMDQVASQIWSSAPIGQTVNQWRSQIKQMTPSPLQAGRG